METEKQIWQNWVATLRRHRLDTIVASVLEASGPLNVVAAQLVYLGQPLVGSSRTYSRLQALAHLLEDSDQTLSFVTSLREDAQR